MFLNVSCILFLKSMKVQNKLQKIDR
jgi:hypothetical protein